MDPNGTNVTAAADVALPEVDVTLKYLRTKDGKPVVVRCEGVSELVMLAATKALPGGAPREPNKEAVKRSSEEEIAYVAAIAPKLLEAGTRLSDGNGGWIVPAFWFDERTPRHPLSIPGRMLREGDKTDLVMAIMEVGGYVGGATEAETFSDRDGAGTDGGGGTVDLQHGGGADAAAGASGS